VLDTAIIEPLLTLLGPHVTAFDQLGTLQPRMGNRSTNNAPRNTYRCADGRWVAVSTSAQPIAERVVKLVGRPDFAEQPWFASGSTRAEHADELDEAVGNWIAERSRDEVISAFEQAQAAVAPIYTAEDILADPQFAALGSIVQLDDEELGRIRIQNVPFRLSDTPGRVRTTGPRLGQHTAEVLASYGVEESEVDSLRAEGVL
jgi:formyl-CoA transferase